MVGQVQPLQAQQTEVPAPALAAEQHPFLEWGGDYPRWSLMTPERGVADIRLAIQRAQERIAKWE